ncbi:hypothetical protein EAb13_CDS0070 [Acinetobacter phage EAb13]|nr:hypothetical protein EAb13_CDS0070 [Acinetobacter phage EAb13]
MATNQRVSGKLTTNTYHVYCQTQDISEEHSREIALRSISLLDRQEC